MLRISLDLGPDASHERGGFSETLPEKGLEFIPNRGNSIVALHLSFVLLLVKVNRISEEQSHKGDAFVAYSSSRIKMILTLSTEIIALHMQVSIVKIGVLGLNGYIPEGGICLACSWPLTNDSRVNLVALCRSLSVYLPGRPGTEAGAGVGVGTRAWAGAGVGAQETAGVLFPLVGAPASSSLLPKGGLRQVHGSAIWLAGWVGSGDGYKLLFFQTNWLTYWV